MPSNGIAKTKWGPKRLIGIALLVVVAGLLVYIFTATPQPKTGNRAIISTDSSKHNLVAPLKTYRLTAAVSPAVQSKGLGDMPVIPDNTGMLFWYDRMDERCFWMQDMQFAIDIIWLDSEKKVVRVAANVVPSTYPETFCAEAQYGIELRAGEAAKSGITTGKILRF